MKKKTYVGVALVIAGFVASIYLFVYPFISSVTFDFQTVLDWFAGALDDVTSARVLVYGGILGLGSVLWLVHLIVSAVAKRLRKNLIASPFAFLALTGIAFVYPFTLGVATEFVTYYTSLFTGGDVVDIIFGIVIALVVVLVFVGLIISFFEKAPVVVEETAAQPVEEKPAEEVAPAQQTTTTTTVTTQKTTQKPVENPPADPAVVKPQHSTRFQKRDGSSPRPTPTPKAPKPAPTPTVENPRIYHVSERKDLNKWQVKLQGGTKALKTFNTQAEAIDYAKELANTQGGHIKVRAKSGKFRKH